MVTHSELLDDIALLILEPLSHPKGRLKGRRLASLSLRLGVLLEKLSQLETSFQSEDYFSQMGNQEWLAVLQTLVNRFPNSPITIPVPGLVAPHPAEAPSQAPSEAPSEAPPEAPSPAHRAIISSNHEDRLREMVTGLAFNPFSETMLESMRLAQGGDPLALYGEILYLFDGTRYREPLWRPCRACQYSLRPSYLDKVIRHFAEGSPLKSPLQSQSYSDILEVITGHYPGRSQEHLRHYLDRALKKGVTEGQLEQLAEGYRLAEGFVPFPTTPNPKCRLCCRRFHLSLGDKPDMLDNLDKLNGAPDQFQAGLANAVT